MKYAVLVLIFMLGACSSANKNKTSEPTAEKAKTKQTETSGKAMKSTKARAAVAAPSDMTGVICTLAKDKRQIQSASISGGTGCEVKYTKWGETRVIGSANGDMGYCSRLVTKVKGNLEGAGFNCN